MTTIDWSAIGVALLNGAMLGMLFGLIPGLGGRTGILLAIPFAFLMDPYPAAVFLFALHSVIHTASSIPAISLGLPLSSADVATVQDGYPLTKMGRGAEALGASLTASVLGGILGALAFLIAIPLVRPIVTNFGPPEIMLLAIFGFFLISSLSAEGLFQAIAVGMIGVSFSMVGEERSMDYARFTFGFDVLSNGFKFTALVCGLFVFPEILDRRNNLPNVGDVEIAKFPLAKVFEGMLLGLRHKFLIFRSSLYGILIGLTPAVGASVAVWLAYDYAVRNVKSTIPYGQGAITGVIAPEAANNSKEGGAMLPSLLLGIPGSSTMAIMMGALGMIGISVGSNMLNRDISLSYILGATVIAANLLAIVPFLCAVPFVVYIARVKRDTLKPIIIITAISAALIGSSSLSTIIGILLSGALGVILTRLNWPRTPFLLGFIVAPMFEGSSQLTAALFGWSVFERPLFILLLAMLAVFMFQMWSRKNQFRILASRHETIFFSCLLVVTFAVLTATALPMPASIKIFPIGVFVVAIISLIAVIWLSVVQKDEVQSSDWLQNILTTGLLVVSVPVLGLPLSGLIYVFGSLQKEGMRLPSAITTSVAAITVQVGVLALVYNLLVEKEIIGRLLWNFLGY